MGEERYSLELAFTEDPSRSFVSGFEAGQIYTLLGSGQTKVECTVHDENIPLFERMAGVKGYIMETQQTAVSGWSVVSFEKVRPASHLYEVQP